MNETIDMFFEAEEQPNDQIVAGKTEKTKNGLITAWLKDSWFAQMELVEAHMTEVRLVGKPGEKYQTLAAGYMVFKHKTHSVAVTIVSDNDEVEPKNRCIGYKDRLTIDGISSSGYELRQLMESAF
jgi:hypothetical protein